MLMFQGPSGVGRVAEAEGLSCLAVWSHPPCLSTWLSAEHAGDLGSILGSGRSPGGGHGKPLQYSSLGSPMDTGAWWATVHEVRKSRVTKHTHKPAFGTDGEPGAQAGSGTGPSLAERGKEKRAGLDSPKSR